MTRPPTDSISRLEIPFRPDFSFEGKLLAHGCRFIAGTDEAGRGPLAGPVVAAAVILDPDHIPEGLDDSKRMSKTARERAFDGILRTARAVAFCSMSAQHIDQTNIRKASLEAMSCAVVGLCVVADHVLVDGRDIPHGLSIPATALIKGDQRSLSISAASIVAKVMRDRMMEVAARTWPTYGFEAHAGYGTTRHIDAITKNGPIERLHRFTFAPIHRK